MSAKKVDEYIETERALYSEKMNALYKDFLKDYSKISALNEKRSGKRLFLSNFAPLISAELTPVEIKQLAKDERVQSIHYSPDVELVPEGDVSVPLIKADVVRDTIGYTGSGMKIGMIESGLPNKNNSYFTSANIIYEPNLQNVSYTPHANRVAAIMVAKATTDENGVTYEGIVPDATLYATCYDGTGTDWRARVEWLLRQGVHVINMSARLTDGNDGEYGTHELWVDHIALNHSVHFVKSAGNKDKYGNMQITSPGMAYNIITVGNIDDKNTLATSDDQIASDSRYVENSELTNKPDLVAPGTNISTAVPIINEWDDDGTSFAAPHVTAVIAQLCQWHTTLRTKQDAMKAILTASINHGTLKFDFSDDEFNQYGAGVINAQEALYTINHNNYVSTSFAANTAQGTSRYYNLNVTTTGLKKRVSLTWLKYSSVSGTHETATPTTEELPNLTLRVYDPNGTLVKISGSMTNNTELIEFTPQHQGNYQIVVTTTATQRTTYYALSWYY